jgi:branched-chain amino acid transport system permease protein
MNKRVLRVSIVVLCLAILTVLPRIVSVTNINMLTEVAFLGLFALSFNMLFGYGGLLSFGHSACFGIGAYAVALLIKSFVGVPLLLALFLGGIAGGLAGLLAGAFCVRLKGGYFALLTMAFNQFFFAIALKWRSLTGGDDGMSLKKPSFYLPGLGNIPASDPVNLYYLVLGVVLLCILVQWYLTTTSFGNAVRAIKENDERASFVGYNPYLTKLCLFTYSSFFAGMAGGLYALFNGFVSTSAIDASMSMHVIFMTFIGGVGSFFGPLLGSGVYLYFTDWVSRITDRWEFVLGVLFVLLVMYARTGLVGLITVEKIRTLLRFKANREDSKG